MIDCRAVVMLVSGLTGFWISTAGGAEQPSQESWQLGRSNYVMCQGCHSPAYNRTGPKHCNLLGRQAGALRGYRYSAALKKSGIRWNRSTLDQFLKSPGEMVPGTSMTFAGIADAGTRRSIIDYLETLVSNQDDCNK